MWRTSTCWTTERAAPTPWRLREELLRIPPTAREDDPERAGRAGLAIVDAMVPLNATLVADDGTHLAVRIGMHTGPVVIADGCEVFGETANVAARVQSAAEPDTVVITAATQRLVAGMFVVEIGEAPLAWRSGWSTMW